VLLYIDYMNALSLNLTVTSSGIMTASYICFVSQSRLFMNRLPDINKTIDELQLSTN
jgi:hypothetical protein